MVKAPYQSQHQIRSPTSYSQVPTREQSDPPSGPFSMDPATAMSGFTAEREAAFLAMMQEMLKEPRKQLPPLPQSWCEQFILPTPQAKKEEDSRPQPRYQATVEDAEDCVETTPETTNYGSTKPDSKSTLSSMPCPCTTRSSGKSAACLSRATFLASLFGFFLGSSLISSFGSLLGLLLS